MLSCSTLVSFYKKCGWCLDLWLTEESHKNLPQTSLSLVKHNSLGTKIRKIETNLNLRNSDQGWSAEYFPLGQELILKTTINQQLDLQTTFISSCSRIRLEFVIKCKINAGQAGIVKIPKSHFTWNLKTKRLIWVKNNKASVGDCTSKLPLTLTKNRLLYIQPTHFDEVSSIWYIAFS